MEKTNVPMSAKATMLPPQAANTPAPTSGATIRINWVRLLSRPLASPSSLSGTIECTSPPRAAR